VRAVVSGWLHRRRLDETRQIEGNTGQSQVSQRAPLQSLEVEDVHVLLELRVARLAAK
jgi:hypothetical protein